MTKKAAALLLAASLAVSVCATPVFADVDPAATGATADVTTTAADATLESMKTTTKTNVVYEVGSSYSWSIPTEINFGKNAGVNATVKVNANDTSKKEADYKSNQEGTAEKVQVTGNTIPVGTSLKISISADTPYETTSTAGKSGFYIEQKHKTNAAAVEHLYYTIAKTADGTALDHTAEIVTVPSGTAEENQALYFALKTSDGAVEMAGKYAAVLKFVAEVIDTPIAGA